MKSCILSTIYVCLVFTFGHALAAADPAGPTTGEGWFCEQGEQNKEWVCIQSETVANTTVTQEPEKRDVRPLIELIDKAESIPEPVITPEPVTRSVSEPELTLPVASDLPLYVQLSHKPGQPINISQLPSEFYVVQLMSLSHKKNLEAYFGKHKLMGLSAARVESNGAILYVLLLGIYESYANAKQASENMPVQLEEIQPWVRRLGSLQEAMVRADEQSGSNEY